MALGEQRVMLAVGPLSAASPYLGVVAVGLLWLVIFGGTGGQLTYEYGINVRGVNPLLSE